MVTHSLDSLDQTNTKIQREFMKSIQKTIQPEEFTRRRWAQQRGCTGRVPVEVEEGGEKVRGRLKEGGEGGSSSRGREMGVSSRRRETRKRKRTSGNQRAISLRAFSTESDPWQTFRPMSKEEESNGRGELPIVRARKRREGGKRWKRTEGVVSSDGSGSGSEGVGG